MFIQMRKESLKESIEKCFGQIPDQRVINRSSHMLFYILTSLGLPKYVLFVAPVSYSLFSVPTKRQLKSSGN